MATLIALKYLLKQTQLMQSSVANLASFSPQKVAILPIFFVKCNFSWCEVQIVNDAITSFGDF